MKLESRPGLPDEGDMGAFLRAVDWAATPLGPVESWPQSLRALVGVMIETKLATLIAFGPDLICLHNDAYCKLLGSERIALGRPFRAVWSEALEVLDPIIQRTLGGKASYFENALFKLQRRGRLEEAYFDSSFTPLRNLEGEIVGFLNQVIDTTPHVLAMRRQAFRITLDDALRGLGDPRSVMSAAAERLGQQLSADRVGYAEIDAAGEVFTVDRDWCAPGMPSLVGKGRLEDFGPLLIAALVAGCPVAVADAQSDPLTVSDRAEAAYRGIRLRAAITSPLIKDGKFVAALYVHQAVPRQWTEEDVALVNEVAERTWTAVEHARAEAKVREGEAHRRALFERLHEGFVIGELVRNTDGKVVDWRYLDVNPAWEELLGVSREAALGRTVHEVIPSIGIEWVDKFTSVVETGQPAIFTRQVGEFGRWYEGRAFRLGAERFAVLFLEITDRKRAEDRKSLLLTLGARLRDLKRPVLIAEIVGAMIGTTLGVAQAAYVVIHPDGDNATVLSPWLRDSTVMSLGGPQRFSDWGGYVDRLRSGMAVVIENTQTDFQTADRRELFRHAGIEAFVNLPLFRAGIMVGMIIASNDQPRIWTEEDLAFLSSVADRTWAALETAKAEADLLALNLDLERQVGARTAERDSVWRNSQDLLCVVDQNGMFRAVNPAWTAILGWSQDEVVGRNHLEFTHPDFLEASEAARIKTIQENLSGFETQILHKNGDYRWFSWVASAEGDLVYASGRDVTAERKATEALALANERIRHSQKMEAVGQLTGGIAHDFNNMLQGIASGVQLMRRRLEQGRHGEVERYLDAMRQSVDRAAALTNRLLAFSRRQALAPKRVNLDDLVPGIGDLIRQTVGPAIEVEIRLADGGWRVRCDPNQMENALLNLAINARDAMMPAGGHLLIETEQAELNQDSLDGWDGARAGDFVRVKVTDTGSGMTPDVLEHAFEPFFTTKPIGWGTGLGLSQVFGFVSQSNGMVRLESKVGCGTSVHLLLPRHNGAEEGSDAVADSRPQFLGALDQATVLLVEDEPDIRRLAAEALRELGCHVLEAVDGSAGLRIMRNAFSFPSGKIDMLVADIGLPGGLNGRQLADAARELVPGLPVLLITGYAGAALGSDDLAPGMHVLGKPFTLEALAACVQAALSPTPVRRRRHPAKASLAGPV